MAWTSYTWGSTALLVAKNSYKPPQAENGLSEIKILPDTSGNPASVVQQGGRARKRASFEGYATESGYCALLTDYYAATSRTFTDLDGNALTAVIENISSVRENSPYPYKYSITLMEV